MNKSLIALGFWLLVRNSVYAGEPITEKNWVNHPEIVEVRSIYQAIMAAKDAGSLKKKERRFDTSNCEPYEDDVRVLYSDQNEKPRIYYYAGGSEDSMVRRELSYDDKGKLRFALIRAGAYNGTMYEYRVYFSKAGKKIRERRTLVEGPGYTFPPEWPDDELIQNPLEAFQGKSPCPEEK